MVHVLAVPLDQIEPPVEIQRRRANRADPGKRIKDKIILE
jgi:hypothetical protein